MTEPKVERESEPKRFGGGMVVEVGDIVVGKTRGRKDFSNLGVLMTSIKTYGLIHPIVVTLQRETGKYLLIAGERRLKAMLALGWVRVPCTLRNDLSSVEEREVELEENLCRKDLSWPEQIELIRQIEEVKRELYGSSTQGSGDERGWSLKKTANLVGESEGGISLKVKFAKLLIERPDLKKAVEKMPLSVAMRVANQKLEGERVERLAKKGKLKLTSELLLGDSRELILKVEGESVGLVLTDPPFGISTLEEQRGEERSSVQSYTTLLKEGDNATEEEFKALITALCGEFERVLKPGGHFYIFHDVSLYKFLKRRLERAGLIPASTPIVWDKGRTTSPFRGYEYSPCYELIIYGCKPPRRRRLTAPARNILTYSPLHATKKRHPFHKPPELLEFLIKQSTNKGELVLDPFAGSGETLRVAKMLGRRGLGFERDEDHWKSAQAYLLGE